MATYSASKIGAIKRRWSFGFKLWAIADDLEMHVDDVVDVLVSQGMLSMKGLEWRLATPSVGYSKPKARR